MNERDDEFSAALLKIVPPEHREAIYKMRARKELSLWLRLLLDYPEIAYLALAYVSRYPTETK